MADDMYQKNSLYNLIRERAGTKMLREAQQVHTYDWVNELFGEEKSAQADTHIRKFHEEYPLLEREILMSRISLEEVEKIDPNELRTLPFMYVYMLRSLTGTDSLAAQILNEKIKASSAAAWRGPFIDVVENKEIFEYIYTRWYKNNELLVTCVNNWSLGISNTDKAAIDFAQAQRERYERVQAIAAEKIAFMRREMVRADRDGREDEAELISLQLQAV